ncbi:MAG: S8/S53 family peptidase [Thermoanaerobaculia bacterium]|nr:S8/S53 family peptidase [Thermoanaerobaculia bacterium]
MSHLAVRLLIADRFLAQVREVLLESLGTRADPPAADEKNELAARVAAEIFLRYAWGRAVSQADRVHLARAQLDLLLEVTGFSARRSEERLMAGLGLELLRYGLEGFLLDVSADQALKEIVSESEAVLSTRLRVDLEAPGPIFLKTPDLQQLSFPEAFELAHRLRAIPGVSWAEASFNLPSGWESATGIAPDLEVPLGSVTAVPAGGGSSHPLPESEPKDWALGKVRAREAWQLSDLAGRPSRGEGVTIGHPDTGYTHHRELDSDRLLVESGFDFWADDHDPWDDKDPWWKSLLKAGFNPNEGHGTSTASVIMSGETHQIQGVAPLAKLVPFRVSSTVVLFNTRRLALAIRAAVDQGCDVISISMGGPGAHRTLDQALRFAEERGVIVCAAAGNQIRYWVVAPARCKTVVGVAASNARNRRWSATSRGKSVSITAPGQDVWRAKSKGSDRNTEYRKVKRGSGTSYAVAHVAGVAALWIAHHGGREALGQLVGGLDRVPAVFRSILATTGFSRPGGIPWESGAYGSGLVDAKKVLQVDVSAVAAGLEAAPIVPAGGFVEGRLSPLLSYFEELELEQRQVDSRLREVLGEDAEDFWDELEMQLLCDEPLRKSLARRIEGVPVEAGSLSGPRRSRRDSAFSPTLDHLLQGVSR